MNIASAQIVHTSGKCKSIVLLGGQHALRFFEIHGKPCYEIVAEQEATPFEWRLDGLGFAREAGIDIRKITFQPVVETKP